MFGLGMRFLQVQHREAEKLHHQRHDAPPGSELCDFPGREQMVRLLP